MHLTVLRSLRHITAFRLLAAVISLLVLMVACEETPSAVSLEGRDGQVVTDTLYATFDATYQVDREFTTIAASRLSLGQKDNVDLRIGMSFDLSGLDDVDVLAAKLVFKTLGITGDPAGPGMTRILLASEDWDIATADSTIGNIFLDAGWQNFRDSFDPNMIIAEETLTPDPLPDSVVINFNDMGRDVISRWTISDAGDTTQRLPSDGFVIEMTSDYILELYAQASISSSLDPYLHLIFNDSEGTLDTVRVRSKNDLTFWDGYFDTPDTSNYAVISTMSDRPYDMVLGFNFDALLAKYNRDIEVFSANLEIIPDSTVSLISPALTTFFLQVLPLTSPLTDGAGIATIDGFTSDNGRRADLSFPVKTVNDTSTTDTTAMTVAIHSIVRINDGSTDRTDLAIDYIQPRIYDPAYLSGLLVNFRQNGSVLSRLQFYRFNHPDAAKRPRLIVKSLLLPGEDF